MDEGYGICCGLDVGKSEHHATALDPAGRKAFDKPLPQDEAKLRELFAGLQRHGRVLVIVDQPNTIGALPVAVARDCGCEVAYLPGLAMRKAADLYPGRSKTDARDAFIIADTARSMPHTLRAVDRDSEVLAALKVLSGFDADLTHECTRAINRLRGLLLQIFPALERVFLGDALTRQVVPGCSSSTPARPACAPQAEPTCCAGPATTAARTRRADREDLHLPGRTERHRPGHRGRRARHPARRRADQGTQTPARDRRCRGRETPGGFPSFQGLDVHAGSRHQDRSHDTPDRRRRRLVQDRRASGRLRRALPDHPTFGHLDPR
jgi:hypothetical protein